MPALDRKHDRDVILLYAHDVLSQSTADSSRASEGEILEAETNEWIAAVSRHVWRLRAYIRRTTSNSVEVEDLLAEVIAEAFCDRHSQPSGLPDELVLILQARKACSRWKAAHRREVELPASDFLAGSVEILGPLDDPTFDTGIVQLWLLTLARQQRAAVVFREFRGSSFEHVAWCLECSVSAAKTHYRRGMAALRRQAELWRNECGRA